MFGISYRKERAKMVERIDRLHDRVMKLQLINIAQQEQIDLLDELLAGRTTFDYHLMKHLGIEFAGDKFVKAKPKGVKKDGK